MSMTEPIRVMIVDDHSMVRRGLATILRVKPGLELVGEASNGQEALQLCEQVQPDVILMDMVMPEMDGAAATRAIRAQYSQIQVIALTSFKEKELVQSALEAGAIGYLLKNISADELSDAIRSAYAGRPTLAPEVAQALLQAERLERFSRALVDAPPDASTLPELLAEHAPGMFPDCQVQIFLFPKRTLVRHPADGLPVPRPILDWLRTSSKGQYFLPATALPWGGNQAAGEGLVVAPITAGDSSESIGGIYVSRREDAGAIADLLPLVKSLAAQVSSTLQSARIYDQTRAHQKLARESAMAGQIQASFLPADLPTLTGWQVATTLVPASQTSGDFYDFIPLPGGQLGIVIADVSDKGMGAALYMALSRTLIRTYAAEHPTRPDLVLSATSRRILADTHAGLFVTVFYGILNTETGTLTYCNAGHNPPHLLDRQSAKVIQTLAKTGMALGAIEDTTWAQGTVQIEPGQVLVLYTDGITDALNRQGKRFGLERLVELLQAEVGMPRRHKHVAMHIQQAVLEEVGHFLDGQPQYDDVTLTILVRES